MPQDITLHLYDEDQRNLQRIKKHHPRWSPEIILRRALAMYANSLEKPAPLNPKAPHSALADIEELFGS